MSLEVKIFTDPINHATSKYAICNQLIMKIFSLEGVEHLDRAHGKSTQGLIMYTKMKQKTYMFMD